MSSFKQVSLSEQVICYRNGKRIQLIGLHSEKISIEIINNGCAITSIFTPDKNGVKKNIVAGFADLTGYEKMTIILVA